jgi:hypothetical protein
MGMINDGAGNGYKAEVTAQKKLSTVSITDTAISDAVHRGKAWNIGTGYLTLTSANISDLLYIKNTGKEHLHVNLYIFLTKDSTGGSGEVDISILRNPNAGTVVSDESTVTATNMNFGVTNSPLATIYKGGEGKTLTGQDDELRSLTTADSRFTLPLLTVLPQGASLGIRITPPTGNTSMDVEVIIELFEKL